MKDAFNKINISNDQNIQKFEDYLNKIKTPKGINKTHKELLWEKLEKEEIKGTKEISQKAIILFSLFKRPVFQYGLALSIIIIFGLSVFFMMNYNKNKINISYELEKGKIFINNNLAGILKHHKIHENDILLTDKNSEANLIVENSSIKIFESTEIKILDNRLKNGKTSNMFHLSKGRIYCNVNLNGKESVFQILTDSALFTVTGTKFYIEINDKKDVSLQVEEGLVKVSKFIKIDINPVIQNPDIQKRLENLLSKNDFIGRDEKIIINNEKLSEFNEELKTAILEYTKNNQEKALNEKISILEQKSLNIIEKFNAPVQLNEINKTEKGYESFIIKKLKKFTEAVLDETGTGVIASKNEILVSSDNNKAVYSINPLTGNLNWVFKDQRIKKIASNAYRYNNSVILGTPDIIFLLNNNGKITSTFDLKKGINYWPDFFESNDIVYIPTSQNIYIYNNNSIGLFGNLPDSNGQLYISKDKNKLYCLNLNSLDILVYNTSNNNVENVIGKIQNRSFMAPLIKNDSLYIADIAGKIYKYDLLNIKKKPDIISVDVGIINMIENKNKLYFIADDGYFYKVDCALFAAFEKIAKVCISPDPDKSLTKKLLLVNNDIYFSSDTGRIFYYDINNSLWKFLSIDENKNNDPLIGTPVKIDKNIYFIDSKSNIYILSKNGFDNK